MCLTCIHGPGSTACPRPGLTIPRSSVRSSAKAPTGTSHPDRPIPLQPAIHAIHHRRPSSLAPPPGQLPRHPGVCGTESHPLGSTATRDRQRTPLPSTYRRRTVGRDVGTACRARGGCGGAARRPPRRGRGCAAGRAGCASPPPSRPRAAPCALCGAPRGFLAADVRRRGAEVARRRGGGGRRGEATPQRGGRARGGREAVQLVQGGNRRLRSTPALLPSLLPPSGPEQTPRSPPQEGHRLHPLPPQIPGRPHHHDDGVRLPLGHAGGPRGGRRVPGGGQPGHGGAGDEGHRGGDAGHDGAPHPRRLAGPLPRRPAAPSRPPLRQLRVVPRRRDPVHPPPGPGGERRNGQDGGGRGDLRERGGGRREAGGGGVRACGADAAEERQGRRVQGAGQDRRQGHLPRQDRPRPPIRRYRPPRPRMHPPRRRRRHHPPRRRAHGRHRRRAAGRRAGAGLRGRAGAVGGEEAQVRKGLRGPVRPDRGGAPGVRGRGARAELPGDGRAHVRDGVAGGRGGAAGVDRGRGQEEGGEGEGGG